MATVLSINASFSVRGGADRFCSGLNRLMMDNGEHVVSFTCKPAPSSDDDHSCSAHYSVAKELYPRSVWRAIAGFAEIFYNPRVLRELERVVEKEKPVIAHIHNIYHRMPYGIIDVLKKHRVRILWWLHDYKWICPNHQLYTRGALCKRCVSGRYTNAMRYRCQQGSLCKSVIVSAFAYFVAAKGWKEKVDGFIAPSQSVFTLFKEFGFPVSKIHVLPHFNPCVHADARESMSESSEKPYALYAGRIEKNKGLFHCIQAFGKTGSRLKVIGSGNFEVELKKYCEANKFSSIEFHRRVAPRKLGSYYRGAVFVVVPSVWYEVFGLAIIEAFHYAKPVVAAAIGAIPEIVEDGKSGVLYRAGDQEDLKKKAAWMFENPGMVRQMGHYAREQVRRKYSPDCYWKQLQALHRVLIDHSF